MADDEPTSFADRERTAELKTVGQKMLSIALAKYIEDDSQRQAMYGAMRNMTDLEYMHHATLIAAYQLGGSKITTKALADANKEVRDDSSPTDIARYVLYLRSLR